MQNKDQSTGKILADLTVVTADKRLSRLFDDQDRACAIELWTLQIKQSDVIETRLLYGRVSPYDFSNSRWNVRDERFKLVRDGLSARCVRLTAFCTSRQALLFLSGLVQGHDLLAASSNATIDINSSIRAQFGALRLEANLAMRPVMHLPPRDYFRFQTKRTSPADDCSADSASITNLDKSELFNVGTEEDVGLAREIVDHLYEETGMEFAGLDAWRLGDIELLVLPGKSDTYATLVDIHRDAAGYKVQILEPLALRADSYRISIRLINDGAICHLGVATIPHNASYPASVILPVPVVLSGILDAFVVEIEADDAQTGNRCFCFQRGAFLIREFNTNMHLQGAKARVQNDWLSIALRPKHAARLEAAEGIERQVTRTRSLVGGRQSDPWVTANRYTHDKMKALLPERSRGRFFLRYAEGENSGRLELAEWIKKLLADHLNDHVAWFDPYMEDIGIHLLNQYGSRNGDYIVFTGSGKGDRAPWWDHVCAWVKSEEAPADREDRRIVQLQKACQQWSTRYGSVRLRVFGLPQDDLHDRMILIRDASMRPIVGYHLSNSLQHANENYPLLITPIPFDVLQQLVEYTDSMLREKMGSTKAQHASNPKLKCLFDSKSQVQESKPQYIEPDLLDMPALGEILDWWFSTSEFSSAKPGEIGELLRTKGLLAEDRIKSDAFQVIPEKLWLHGLPSPNFNSAWDALGALLAWTRAGDSVFEAPRQPVSPLRGPLLAYLDSDRRDAIQPPERQRLVVDMTDQLRRSLNDLLSQSANPEQLFPHDVIEVSWGDFYAFKALWAVEPMTLIDWIDEGAAEYFRNNRRRQIGLKCAVRLIVFATSWNCTYRQLVALLKSKNDLIRWIGYVAFEGLIRRDIQELGPSGVTLPLNAADRLRLLGWLTARAAYRDSPTLVALVEELHCNMPEKLGDSELRSIVDSMRDVLGRIYASPPWIFRVVLEPLIRHDRVDVDVIAKLWFDELVTTWRETLDTDLFVFKHDSEGKFTEEVAGLCAISSSPVKIAILEVIDKIFRESLRTVQRPFATATHNALCNRSFQVIVWISGFLHTWTEQDPTYGAITTLLNQVESALSRRSGVDWQRSYTGELLRFRKSHQ